MTTHRPKTVGALKETDYRPRSVKDELRRNLIVRIRQNAPIFDGIIGYDDTVIPQIANAILSRHDLLLLGLRGQAKTRLIRALPRLLDEWCPVIAGTDLPDDPLAPQFPRHRRMAAEQGDELEIRWLHRDERFHEKLATPDVTVADLVGEIDLVKHAEGRYLTDEAVVHYGLVPRTNRGIFAINELPDLAPRIQVALFNALEERDIQIRGFPIRLPLDVMMAFTANPEDYTNRGRIVTPLKDRIGSVVRTHYPLRPEHALAITQGNAWLRRESPGGMTVDVPPYMFEIIEELARLARKSPHVNQQSGVSVRASIANAENLVSNAERRCLKTGEKHVVPRVSDLQHLIASCRGKLELILAEDERAEDKLIHALIGEAVKNVFENYGDLNELDSVIEAFAGGKTNVEVGDEVTSEDLLAAAGRLQGLVPAARKLCKTAERPIDDPAELAGAVEFILEALFVSNKLSKYAYHGRTFFKR
ncbi:MAG: magnesium chelatase [Phycisphaerales bacterium]|nr:MAG: magnesium chelatase [Phycisphaerales bacterium]